MSNFVRNEIVDIAVKAKEKDGIAVIDLSIPQNIIKNPTAEELDVYHRKQALIHDVLEEMDCTNIIFNDLHNVSAHVPENYKAEEYVLDILNQCNVIFKISGVDHVIVNLDLNTVTFVNALSNLATWRNNKNPFKKKENRES